MSEFWNRLDDIMSRLPDEEEDIGDIGMPNVFSKGGGGSGARPASAPTNPPNVNSFFDSHYDRISKLARDMNTSPNLLLGLTAHESGWGNKNNLFGLSVNDIPNQYASPDDSIDAFRKSRWFSRLSNKGDANSFVGEMMKPPMYNSKDGYEQRLRGTLDSVNRRQPIWEQSR